MFTEQSSKAVLAMSLSPYEEFKVETDPFVIEADLEIDLDDKWTSLAQHLLNETNDKK